jgi:hypothetical protein
MKNLVSAFIVAFSLLTACVPSVTLPGGSPSNPIPTTIGLPIDVVYPGSTWYFISEFNPDRFGYTLSERNNAFDDSSLRPVTGQKRSSTVRGFSTQGFETPEGWNVSLQRAYLQREILDVDSDSYTYNDSLFLVFAVSVPADAPRGSEAIFTTIQRGTESQRIPLLVKVSDAPTE